ncbi:MAG: Mannose-6-phosphate isomerase [Marmoricola sp.]|nr:Mannose-6-phosphate isomerase [Marmoricola sp.]
MVSGLATCTVGDTEVAAGGGEPVDMPCGAVHRIANTQHKELIVIEVEPGDYTGEDGPFGSKTTTAADQ